MSLAHESDPDTIYVFASKAGAPTHPEWYRNLVTAGRGRVETGEGEYEVDVTELEGEERDRIFAKQASRYEGFAGYADKTAGIRTIPVLALRRRSAGVERATRRVPRSLNTATPEDTRCHAVSAARGEAAGRCVPFSTGSTRCDRQRLPATLASGR